MQDRTYAVELKNKNGKHLTVYTILLIRSHVRDFILQVRKSCRI